MTDNRLEKKEKAALYAMPRMERPQYDFCCKCERRIQTRFMSEIGFQVYACHKCLMS